MVNKWPFIAVASVFNSLLITTSFINFKWQGASGSLHIHPALFAAGMFVFTFLAIIAVIFVAGLITSISAKLYSFNKSLANVQPPAANPLDVA